MKTKKVTGRDTSTYTFQRVSRGKGQTVLSVLKAFSEKKTVNFESFMDKFGGCNPYPIIMTMRKAKVVNANGDHKRYFDGEDQSIKLKDGRYLVTNQWTTETFLRFLAKAKKEGYRITQD